MIIQIMNHHWKIIKKSEKEMNEITPDLLGLTRFPFREILLLDSLAGESLKQVVTHEVVHVVLDEFGYGNTNEYDTEFVCDFISNNNELIVDIRNKVLNVLK